MSIKYKIVRTENDFEIGKKLFREYAESLNIDLSFQNFEKELQTVHIQYNSPDGALILVDIEGEVAGCVGVRRFDAEVAELKRMYVRPEFRGYKLGVGLLEQALEMARELGYQKIRLDTLADMHKAQQLYQSFGFYTIPSYRYNPIEGTLYMEKDLSNTKMG